MSKKQAWLICVSSRLSTGEKGRSEKDAMKSRIARLEKQQSVADRFRRPLDLQDKRVKAELKETAQVITSNTILCSTGMSRIFLGLVLIAHRISESRQGLSWKLHEILLLNKTGKFSAFLTF